jgi:hypothetical protein
MLAEAGSKQSLLHDSFFFDLFFDPGDGGNLLL